MDNVTLYILDTMFVKDNYDFVLSFIDPKRKEKAEKHVHEKDRLLSLGAAYLLKKYLPKGEIKEYPNGKPYLEDGPYFNISHSGECAVLAVHKSRDVGVDIQIIDKSKINAVKYVLNDNEKNIADDESLFKVWSNKESLIKCLSSSLKDIRSIDGIPLTGNRVFNNNEFYTVSRIFDDYALSITLKGKDPFEININIVESL